MDDLIQQLDELCIERANNAAEHQRFQQASNQQEHDILVESPATRQREQREQQEQREQRRVQNSKTDSNHWNNRSNPLKIGEVVRITNSYKDVYGVRGTNTQIGGRMVDIWCVETGKRHTREWWNLQRVSTDQNAQ